MGRLFWVVMFVIAQVLYTIKESVKKANTLYDMMQRTMGSA